MRLSFLLSGLSWLLFAFALSPCAFAQDEEDGELPRGLIATYASRDFGDETATRVDRTIAMDWGGRLPDPRLSQGPFTAQWRGYLLTQGPGEYRLAAHAAGEVKITLAGQVILNAAADEPQWMEARPVEMPFGWQPIQIDYVSRGQSPRLALFWSGPQFGLEPIGERQFYHDAEDAPSDRFTRGEQLVAALRCFACHAADNVRQPLPAPALDRLTGNVSQEWLVWWLTEEKTEGRRMPHFGLTENDATAVAAYLLSPEWSTRSASGKTARGASGPLSKDQPNKEKPSVAAGEKLFLTLGCLACHQVGDFGESGLFGGGDLSRVAEKRPPRFFEQWLANPEMLNRDHRMPMFELSDDERKSLSLYLATLGEKKANEQTSAAFGDESLRRQGRRLVEANRCGACHALPQEASQPAAPAASLSSESNWDRACSGEPHAGKQPGYRLTPEDREAVREYVLAVSGLAKPAPPEVDARLVLQERNCLACHERNASPGLGAKLTGVAAAHADLAPLLPAMTPPPLTSVGDKLHEKALAEAIRRTGGVHRPWLEVRMPKFDLSDEELDALVRHFAAQDRIPPREEEPTEPPVESPGFVAAGARLVTSDGFGCVSCHKVGSVEPEKAPLNARGPDLSLLSSRIRREWFDRWVRNPARIVPRMEMPAVQLPVRGVLEDDLDRQLAAVWKVLNTPGFEPPPPNPVRVLRRSGVQDRSEWAVVGTDVHYDRGREHLKPLLVGLPNRHNFLFDLAKNRTAAWWLGDAARQRTKGKTWFWESGAGDYGHLLEERVEGSELALEIDGQVREPLTIGQFPTELDEWRHVDGGVQWRHRLRFASENNESPIVIHVEQTLTPIWPSDDSPENGFRRTIALRGLPAGAKMVLRVLAANESGDVHVTKQTVGRTFMSVTINATGGKEEKKATGMNVRPTEERTLVISADDGAATIELNYLTARRPDTFPQEPPALPPSPPTPLHVAPGFEAVRLPLSDEIMPTALAWTPDGALAIASLKGRVWLARDTDNDGLEDHAAPFSDDLAAPYGLQSRSRPPDGASSGQTTSPSPDNAVNRQTAPPPKEGSVRRPAPTYVDVINKYALLRLFDEDGDGRAERTVTLASGWGHTTDYHDWAVGLPRDEAGNYYVALPCQQDDRSEAAAHLRGKVLRLVPREPTEDDPRRFAIEVISGGHRFPMGIARRSDGELFVTDNQGNYNPFNELNHVLPGRRYGFINKLEQKKGFDPPLTPPAIDLPHPWTRSVNGICFLDTPPEARERLGRDAFGPFEGHLVGCEMNNKLLVRMTLHRVGDTMQGAVYPLTYETPKEGPSLLGPLCAEVSPEGDLYVGSLLDSGWGGGNNIGAVVRMRPTPEEFPTGIREVRAEPHGLVIEFTRPVDRERAENVENYSLSTYTRISTPAYGGPDVDRRTEQIRAVEVAPDATSAVLQLDAWREGYVYELRLNNLAPGQQEFFPAEAHYTLRQAPD